MHRVNILRTTHPVGEVLPESGQTPVPDVADLADER